jgi:hypothetical protein
VQILRASVLLILVVSAIAICILVLPGYLVTRDIVDSQLEPAQLAKAKNDVRATLLQGLGGVGLLIGLFLTWRQMQDSRQSVATNERLSREGQAPDRFARAVDQLGSDQLAVRLGGIHALARIARDSEPDRRAIMQLLAAFIRTNSPWPPPPNIRASPEETILDLPHLPIRAADIQEPDRPLRHEREQHGSDSPHCSAAEISHLSR